MKTDVNDLQIVFLTHIWKITSSSSDTGLLQSSNLNMQLLECIQNNVCT